MALLTIPTRIRRDLVEALEAIRKESGWNVDLSIEGRERPDNVPADGSCVVELLAVDEDVENASLGSQRFIVTFSLAITALLSETSGSSLDEHLLTIWADINKALKADVHRGAVAENTFIDPPTIYADGMTIDVKIPFKCKLGDLYTLVGS